MIRLRSLGDCVLTTPALALLKTHRPDLGIGVVVEDRFRGGVRGQSATWTKFCLRTRAAVARWRPQMALNLHGGTRSMWLTAASRAEIRAGFAHHAYSFLYNAKIPRAQEILGEERPVHTAEHLASAMFWLGVPQAEIPRARLSAGAGADRGSRTPCCIPSRPRRRRRGRPSASSPSPSICGRSRLEPVFLAGPADDPARVREFRVLRNAPLAEVKSLHGRARSFSSATTAARRTSRRRSAFLWWCCSAPAIR